MVQEACVHSRGQWQKDEALTDFLRLLLQAVLGLLEGTEGAWLKEMIGCVINVNVPAGPLHAIKGLHLAHQVGIAVLCISLAVSTQRHQT